MVRRFICLLFVYGFIGATLDFSVSPTVSAQAEQDCTYTISPSDSLSSAVGQLDPGETLCLLDGSYDQSLYVSGSGNSTDPITIRAVNDGAVTIDGENVRRPATIIGNYIVVEGIIFQNSSDSVVQINGDHNIFRRCSAYQGYFGANDHAWLINEGRYNLLEDCIAAATERHLFITWSDDGRTTNNTFRRCFGYGYQLPGDPKSPQSDFNIYGGSEDIIENSIGWMGTIYASISIHSADYTSTYSARDNKVFGSIFLGSGLGSKAEPGLGAITGYGLDNRNTYFDNCVFGQNLYGIRMLSEGSGMVFNHCTIANNTNFAISSESSSDTVKNTIVYENGSAFSSADGSFSFINLYGNGGSNNPPSSCQNCISENPQPFGLTIPADSPMKGAGENGEDIGANICYRYENGILTDEPLWPWPMQDRILQELGIDVMQELEQMFGPIPAECKGEGTETFSVSVIADPSSGAPPLSVDFDSIISNGTPPYSYSWSFGDSQTSKQANPSHTYTTAGNYTATLTVTDSENEQASDSTTIRVIDPGQVLSISDVRFTSPGQSQALSRLQTDTWYDLYIHFNSPNGWGEISFADLWLSAHSYTEGTIENRGGTHYAARNYVLSYSIASEEIWAKETEGSQTWSNISGILSRYVDDDQQEYEQNSSQGWAKARVMLLGDAEAGIWKINAYAKEVSGALSELYSEEIAVETWLAEDVNRDGFVNSIDIQLCANVLTGQETDPVITQRADVNDDGIVDSSDIEQIVRKILGI
jgi:PKD repeat protein